MPLRHHAVVGWHLNVRHVHQFQIQNQIRLGGNRRMIRIRRWTFPRTQPQLPGHKHAPLAADPHAVKSLVPAGKRTAHALDHRSGLRIAQLGLTVIAQHRFAVLVQNRSAVVVGGVELAPVDRQP